jgi:hypothetical protein
MRIQGDYDEENHADCSLAPSGSPLIVGEAFQWLIDRHFPSTGRGNAYKRVPCTPPAC